jgi:transcriptional regulator with XRE-family HTH domain
MSTEKDLAEFRHILRELLRMAHIPVRQLERTLGVGSGKLERLLNGEMEIRLRHILAAAEVLGMAPGDLLTIGCGDASRRAQRRVVDWLPHLAPKAEGPPFPTRREELAQMIREILAEELDAREPATASSRPSGRRKRS